MKNKQSRPAKPDGRDPFRGRGMGAAVASPPGNLKSGTLKKQPTSYEKLLEENERLKKQPSDKEGRKAAEETLEEVREELEGMREELEEARDEIAEKDERIEELEEDVVEKEELDAIESIVLCPNCYEAADDDDVV